MYTGLIFLKSRYLALVILAWVIIVPGCEHETVLNMSLGNTTPPSFSISGNRPASQFEIAELPRTEPLNKAYSLERELIWKISAPANIEANKWSTITYGIVPNGFSQAIPENVPPRKLEERKLYVARIVDSSNKGGTELFFEIHDGKAVNVTHGVWAVTPTP